MPSQGKPFNVFCSYAPEDEALCLQLETHLRPLQRQGLLALWHHRKISPGTNWAEAIDAYLNQANVILLLVSPDFLASDYCYGVEVERALQRHESDEARVIPILMRPSLWKSAPFAHLAALPTNGISLTRWTDQDSAFVEVAEGIQRVIQELQASSVAASVPRKGNIPDKHKRIWNIPFLRNRFFLGRDELLATLRKQLQAEQPLAISQPQAVSGLGGIGKTQLVLEYAYRFADEYQAVLWTRADSRETLLAGFVEFARLLRLPEHDERDQAVTIEAVKGWLSQQQWWLLVLDNADDLTVLPEFLPAQVSGHILLTTRAQAVGQLATRLEVDILDEEAGMLLLLRRAGTLVLDVPLGLADDTSYVLARQLYQELGGLPLALDQAGAYIEGTQCGLQGYLQLFHERRGELLQQRGGIVQDHEAVATTWSLSFAEVEAQSVVAADLLRLGAILHPDAIPEELLLRGAPFLGENLEAVGSDRIGLNRAFALLTGYSLIRRSNRDQTFSMHRLVQAVLQDTMGEQTQIVWIERAISALYQVFPSIEHTTWETCERLLPHVLLCLESRMLLKENAITASLALVTANYLRERVHYAEAEPLYQRALRIREAAQGAEHPDVATPLNGLADLYNEQGKYAEAEPLYQRALRIREAALGAEHPDVATPLNNLAILYYAQGKYTEAEPLYQRALQITEAALGAEHPLVAYSLYGLANLYKVQGKYVEAEPLYQRALQITEAAQGVEHPDVVTPLDGLAGLYNEQGKYAEAELLYQRALRIGEAALGAEHPDVATPLNGLAILYAEQGKYAEAEPLFQQALQIRESALGAEHPDVVYPLNGLANLYKEQGKYAEAEPLYQRALRIGEAALGVAHPQVGYPLTGLANLYKEQGKYAEAEPLYQRALRIWKVALGAEHQLVAYPLTGLADLYKEQGKYAEAEPLYQRALRIREAAQGAEHSLTVHARTNYEQFLQVREKAEGVKTSGKRKRSSKKVNG